MRKTHLLLTSVILFLFSLAAQAQSNLKTIKGVVLDSTSQKPEQYLTVALKKDKEVIKNVVTDEGGKFAISKIENGSYILSLIGVGYKTKNISLVLNDTTSIIDLKNILIEAQATSLKEVSIQASKPVIKQEPDRITYDIQADPENKVLTVLDMMRKVPLLSVDAEDNIKLKGSGNYKILINGKPSGMVSRDPREILRGMPASSIQKIEVITTPPSKYDSEGLSGIINIITNKKIGNGYNGSVNLRTQFPTGGPGGIGTNFTFKQGRFGLSAYGGTGLFKLDGVGISDSRTTTGAISTSLYGIGTNSIDNNWRYGGAELSYEIDSLNLITAEINPYSGYNKQTNFQHFDILEGTVNSSYNLNNQVRYGWGGLDNTLNYQLGFKGKKEHLLTFSYKYFKSSQPQDNVTFDNRTNSDAINYKQHNDNVSTEQTAQIDYINPIKKINLELGLKAILRDEHSDFKSLNFDPVQNQYILDASQSNVFGNKQRIFGAYNTYTLNLEKWTFKAGARIEGTYVTANFETTNTSIKTDYFNLIPAISLNRKFNQSSLSLGFTQRIERPGIYFLNPFVDKRPNFEIYGNPNLKAVLSNNFELTYSTFKKGSINIGLSYNFANNTQQSVYLYDEARNVTSITYLNIGKDRTLTTNMNVNYPITGKWNISANGNVGYTKIQGIINGADAKNDGFTGYISLNSSYKFEKTWRASVSYSYSAPSVLLQGKSNSYYFLSFSGSKDLIKDKLTLSASAANPFVKYRAYENHTEGPNFVQDRVRVNYFRRFNASLNWRFGKLEGSIKKNERKINNTDAKSGGNGGG